MNRHMIRVSAMDLPRDEFISRINKFEEIVKKKAKVEIFLAVLEDKNLNGKPVHLHTHIYLECDNGKESMRKYLKQEVFTEDKWIHVKGMGHKPIVIQDARESKEQCYKYLLKLNPPEIISKYNVDDEEIKLLKNKWINYDKEKRNVKDIYLDYMSKEISETEYAQLSDPLYSDAKKRDYVDKVVLLTVDFFIKIIEKPFAIDVIDKYTRLWLCKTNPDTKNRLVRQVAQSFYYGY